MASGDITITVNVVRHKQGRVIHVGEWRQGGECSECKHLTGVFGMAAFDRIDVCPKCGHFTHLLRVAVRWVRTKTGFWPWQTEGHYEKKKL